MAALFCAAAALPTIRLWEEPLSAEEPSIAARCCCFEAEEGCLLAVDLTGAVDEEVNWEP